MARPAHALRLPQQDRAATHQTRAHPTGRLVAATILLAPVLVVFALRLPLINQLDYADAWFYSAYGWVPKHHFAVFGFNYFSVRFPAILSIGSFEKVFGVELGYVLLRYVLAVATGASIFAVVLRFSRRSTALGATMLLYLNPFFSRMLLWDYSYFVAVSAGTAGIALWWWAEGRRWGWTLLAGACLAIAAFAHASFVTILFVLVVLEIVAALRTRTLARLVVRFGLCLVASACVFAVGWLAYLALLGSVEPGDMLRPTVDFLRDNETQAAPYVQPVSTWVLHLPRIWAPVALSLALVVVLRGALLGSGLPARIAQLCIGYTAFAWLFRFTVTSSFIETWWSYHITVVVMAPATGVLLHTLGTRGTRPVSVAAISVATAATTALAIRNLPWGVHEFYDTLNRHSVLVLLGLLVTISCVLLLSAGRRGSAAAGLVGILLCSGVMMYSPDVLDSRGGTGIFVTDGDRDWRGYSAGHQFVELVRDHERRGDAILLWYPSPTGYTGIAWADLPQTGNTLQPVGTKARLDALGESGVARLMQPQVGAVLVMSTDPGDLPAARSALEERGFGTGVETQGAFGEGHIPYVLLDVESKP